uniref:Putative membrane glycoprotein lig-1 n=1 Tax=Lutzomyia longipalpis TaxID=7200 RepID=A0A1B0CHY2_LUTLO
MSSCPSEVCICKWKGGKQTVECGGRNLLNLPDHMDPGTQVLNFSGNSLTNLPSERFLRLELINLQKIYLSRNHIMKVHSRAFKGLTNLVELDLSENMLTSIPTDTFQDYSSLMRLSLSRNPIRELKAAAFRHLSYLTTLELSHCQIETVENEAFIGMDNLEWLRLDGNRMHTIVGDNILPTSLHGIDLHGNQWRCDCHLIDIHSWLMSTNVPQIEDPVCASPARLTGVTIKSVSTDELACLPHITPTTLYLEIAEGRNVSLYCKITSIPESTVSWWFQGQILQNESMVTNNLHLYYYIDEGIEEKRSDLFIYNANAENNGTFACLAENAAGRSQANYTIRVIVKEKQVVEDAVTLTDEHLYMMYSVGGGVGGILFIIGCIIICRYVRRSKVPNDRRINEVSLETSPTANHVLKTSHTSHDISSPSDPSTINKHGVNGGVPPNGTIKNSTALLITDENFMRRVDSPQAGGGNTGRVCSGGADPNPDLINDAESKGQMCNDARVTAPRITCIPRNISRDMYYDSDVHLNPINLFSAHGECPKVTMVAPEKIIQVTELSRFGTMPHPSRVKMHTYTPLRYSQEAEFLKQPPDHRPFDMYTPPPNLRCTVDGYPCGAQLVTYKPNDPHHFPSPPEPFKNDTTICSPIVSYNAWYSTPQPWPPCLPAYQIKVKDMTEKRSASAQTIPPADVPESTAPATIAEEVADEEAAECAEAQDEGGEEKLKHFPLADSPDEGYEDMSQEGM